MANTLFQSTPGGAALPLSWELTETRTDQGRRGGRRIPRWLIPVIGYSIAIGCLFWVYRGFDWTSEIERLRATHWGWVSLAVVFDILVYVCQGWRWSVLLNPLASVPMIKSTQAVYIGLFANEVLPLRSGEVIRCYLQRRWSGLPLSVVVSSAIIERMMDGVWLILGLWVVGYFVPLPGWLVNFSNGLAVLLALLAALVVWAIFYRSHARQAATASRWARWLRPVVDGVHAMGRSRSFLLSALLSLCYLALQILPVWCLMKGYGIELPVGAAATILVILRLGTVVPQAPGNVGSFQALTVLGLRIFAIDREIATGFATLLFVVVTLPLYLAGFVALIATRMRLDEIHREAREDVASSEQNLTYHPGPEKTT